MSLVAVVIPMAVTTAIVTALYGVPDPGVVILVTAGMAALAALFTVVGLAAATVVTNQAAVAAIGFGMFFVPTLLVAIVPFDIEPFLPTSILGWSIGFAMGAPVGIVTPIAWALAVLALAAVGVRRLEVTEL